MTTRNTLVRSFHDLGLAAWFGGNLMGAVGLNGAASTARDANERLAISSNGWARWFPVQLGAMVLHGIGGVGLIVGNTGRLAVQGESRANTGVKLALTVAAIGTTAWSGVLGARMTKAAADGEVTAGTTEPSPVTSDEVATTQRQQRILQWVTPALTAALIVLAAQQGEQQREPLLRRIFQ